MIGTLHVFPYQDLLILLCFARPGGEEALKSCFLVVLSTSKYRLQITQITLTELEAGL